MLSDIMYAIGGFIDVNGDFLCGHYKRGELKSPDWLTPRIYKDDSKD
jgi:hypothetical protein